MTIDEFKEIALYEDWFYNWLETFIDDTSEINIEDRQIVQNDALKKFLDISVSCAKLTHSEMIRHQYPAKKIPLLLALLPTVRDKLIKNDNHLTQIKKIWRSIYPGSTLDRKKDYQSKIVFEAQLKYIIKILTFISMITHDFDNYRNQRKSILERVTYEELNERIRENTYTFSQNDFEIKKNDSYSLIEHQKWILKGNMPLWNEDHIFTNWKYLIEPI